MRETPSLAGSLGTPREQFLDSVRLALGRAPGPPEAPYGRLSETLSELEARAQEIQQRLASIRPALLDRLAEVAQLRGWRVHRTPDPEMALEYIGSVANDLGVRRVVRADQEVFTQLPVDRALKLLGLSVTAVARRAGNSGDGNQGLSPESLREETAAAGLGITGADYAVAETGSVVLLPRQGLGRLVSLVPPVHLALVRPEEVLETLDDLFLLHRLEYHRKGGDMGSYLNFITGPSRTADIEQTLVEGVHGPKEVHLVLLG